MSNKRKAISKRVRFSVFSRDGFSCRYCGAQSDQVQLVLDHVQPVSLGGTNEPENLVTACQPCNAGKSNRPVDQTAINESHRLALAQEMREQEGAITAAKVAATARRRLFSEVEKFYKELQGERYIGRQCLVMLVHLVNKHGAETAFEWMGIASDKLGPDVSDVNFTKYVYGIRRKQLKEQEACNG